IFSTRQRALAATSRGGIMSLGSFFKKQFVDVIHWTESGDGVLAYRYPMQDMEIQYGAQLTVRESQMALFVNEGKAADAFGPGLHTLETRTLPLLTNLMNWDKLFQSPFKSDVYFFSTRLQTDQRWGTQNPITIRDKDFGMVRLRGHGIYSYHLGNPRDYTQLQVAQSIPTAAANEGGGAGLGDGLGAGLAMGKAMADAIGGGQGGAAPPSGASAAPAPGATKFCGECGKSIPRTSK